MQAAGTIFGKQQIPDADKNHPQDGKDYEDLIESKRSLKITKKEILSNLDLADKMKCNLNDTSIDAKPILMQLAEEE